jgi:UDP-glucuronate decarboxylase
MNSTSCKLDWLYDKNKNILLVTGGAGFLGRHLCKRLLTDPSNNVICLDNLSTGSESNIEEFIENPRFCFVHQNVESPLFFPHINEIYHLACMASPDKYKQFSIETLTTCFQGTKNVLDLAEKHGAKVLFTSTSEVYGDPLVHPQVEDYYGNVNTVGERSCYDEGKRVAETLIYEYRKKRGVDGKIVRLFNTYGPYMSLNDGRVITNFINQVMQEKDLVIYGDGNQTRSFCYVDDLIDGLIKMMASKETGPINLGNPNCEVSLNQLVEIFEESTGKKLSVQYVDFTENDPKRRKPDIEKARKLLGFEPKIGIREGLMKTMDYFIS